ncbi:MAG TPA: tripartite tricarboxylate transporter substrate-binding protein [Roseomonas sp.]|jgi:tripartite-type tricarboxylate transporter receptor subunit TctC
MPPTRRALLAATPAILAAPAVWAQDAAGFPNRPVTLIAGGTAGGPTDLVSRLVAEGMARHLGQTVVVENVAGTVFSAGRARQARPDGYTLLNTNVGFAASATLYRQLPYSVTDSFAPIGLASKAAMMLVARPGFPAANVTEYAATMRREGEKLNLAHSGIGSSSQLSGMLLQQSVGAQVTTVAYRGSAPIMTELMAGRVDIFCDQVTNVLPFVQRGSFPAFAVTSEARVPGVDLPTMAEAGMPAAAMTTWHGLFAQAEVPEAIQERLSQALRAAVREERLVSRFTDLITAPATQEEATIAWHRRFHAAEVARWRGVVQAAGIYAN